MDSKISNHSAGFLVYAEGVYYMKNNEIWGIKPKDFHEMIGAIEAGTGVALVFASVLLAVSGGCFGAIPAGLVGLKLISNGSKELIKVRVDPKYRDD